MNANKIELIFRIDKNRDNKNELIILEYIQSGK